MFVCQIPTLCQNVNIFMSLPKRIGTQTFFLSCQIVLYACMWTYVCTYGHKMLPPGIFLLLMLSSSSSWSSLHFPLKLELAIYREKMGDTIKAGSIYQSRSDRLHYVLFPSSAALKQEGRESPRRNPALPAHQRPTGGGEKLWRGGGGWEDCGNVWKRERECKK